MITSNATVGARVDALDWDALSLELNSRGFGGTGSRPSRSLTSTSTMSPSDAIAYPPKVITQPSLMRVSEWVTFWMISGL